MSENKKVVMYTDEGEIVFVKYFKNSPEDKTPWINGESVPTEGYVLQVTDAKGDE